MLPEEKQFEEYGKDWIDRVDWDWISECQKLSEAFIEKHAGRVNWDWISKFQKLSEKFIEKHADEVDWYCISKFQKLSEKFIEKHADRVNWYWISKFQKLSEKFIEKHADKINWDWISSSQKLSEEFIEKHAGKVNKKVQLRKHHRKYDAVEECKNYAEKHKLTIKDGFLHAFRKHDAWGRGFFNKTIFYTEKNVEYRDWHCDLDPNEIDSFGLGIWPKGNVEVKVKLEDFGCEVERNGGKARVWCFQLV